MKKEQVLEKINGLQSEFLTNEIISNIKISLKKNEEYELDLTDTSFKINTILKDGKNGTYEEIIFNHDNETNNNSLIIIRKEYSPALQQRNIRKEVGLDIFTKATSYVFDKQNKLQHTSSFIDDNKYYGNNLTSLEYSKEALLSYFNDTNPKYNNGFYVEGPNNSYQPFTNIWHRYPNTHVVKEFGRDPINGEYSKIKITFDDHFTQDQELLSESYGRVYKKGYELKMNDVEEIVPIIEEIYQDCQTEFGFDSNTFYQIFEEKIFENNTKKH